MEIKGFYISCAGDPEVGIPSTSWEFVSDFYFEDSDDLNWFMDELRDLFENHTGEGCRVQTLDDIEKQEAEFMKTIEPEGDFMPPDESLI